MQCEQRIARMALDRVAPDVCHTVASSRCGSPKTCGEYVGAYIADLVIDNTVIVELKSVKALNEIMEAQLLNYLRLSKLQVGYVINFNGMRVVWRRLINATDG